MSKLINIANSYTVWDKYPKNIIRTDVANVEFGDSHCKATDWSFQNFGTWSKPDQETDKQRLFRRLALWKWLRTLCKQERRQKMVEMVGKRRMERWVENREIFLPWNVLKERRALSENYFIFPAHELNKNTTLWIKTIKRNQYARIEFTFQVSM